MRESATRGWSTEAPTATGLQLWADGLASLRNSLLLEVGQFLTGHCAMNKVLGSQPTDVCVLPLVEADGLRAHNSEVPCSTHIMWPDSLSML